MTPPIDDEEREPKSGMCFADEQLWEVAYRCAKIAKETPETPEEIANNFMAIVTTTRVEVAAWDEQGR